MEERVLARVRRRGRGVVFTPREFLDLGTRSAIGTALHRLTKQGQLRRIGRGLYDLPRRHAVLGELAPTVESVLAAIAAHDRIRVLPTGAQAANLLGLAEQVPARAEFLTDGPARTLQVGARTVRLRPTTPRNLAAADRLSGVLIQALRHVGKDAVTEDMMARLAAQLPLRERQQLLADLPLAPAWMHSLLRRLAKA